MFLKLVVGIAIIIGLLEMAFNGNYVGGAGFFVAAALINYYFSPLKRRYY